MTEETSAEGHKERLIVTVHDEDAGGEPYKFHAGDDVRVQHIIDELYTKVGGKKEGDRLYCIANGDDVFPHAHERLEEYAEHVCRALEWGFARATGGA
jgi:hypothetical protein